VTVRVSPVIHSVDAIGNARGRGKRESRPQAAFDLGTADRSGYMRSIIAWPKPEHDTCFAPSISRAKS